MNKNKNKKTLWILVAFSVLMYGFAFALVPFYNLMCKVLALNGKTNSSAVTNKTKIDYTRSISIGFLATTNSKLNWDFYPEIKKITLHPGENIKIFYIAKNNVNTTITAQAVPSVSPTQAAKYLKKIECFCFRKQTIQSHEMIKMPVIFYVDPAIPKNIHEITLSYSINEWNP